MSDVAPEKLEFRTTVRCYDGAFDSKSQAVLNERTRVMKLIRQKEPEAHATYFPVEEEYVIHVWGRDISGYHKSYGAALYDAYTKLYGVTES